MQKTNDLLSAYVFDLSNPDKFIQLVKEFWAKKGVKIQQDKTVAVYTAFVNAVAVGNPIVTFNFPDVTFGTANGGASGATFPDSEHMLIVGMKLYQGANASLTATPWSQGITDAALLNGRLSINNSGTVVLKDLPLTRFPSSTNNADLDGGYFMFDNPIAWVGQTSLFATCLFPTATATANTNLRMELIGIKLI